MVVGGWVVESDSERMVLWMETGTRERRERGEEEGGERRNG